jgi:pimeloyl-ACP methyl ester carboxylesterase
MVTRRLAALLVVTGIAACGPSGPQPPPTAIRPVVDEIHGERFTDPYRWLEEQDHADVRAWVEAQNRYADEILARTPADAAVVERLRTLSDTPDIGRLQRGGDFEYFTLRRTGDELAAIYRRPRPESPADVDPGATYERIVDPTPLSPDGKKQLERQSPLFSADKIKTPLFVVQGANDPRVKKAESDQIVVALRDRKFPIEYMVAPDEGHGFNRPVNNMAMFAAIEKFLAKHLGGRYQESMTPEVATRLKEIMVEPNTVVLTKPVETTDVTMPSNLQPMNPTPSTYAVTMSMGGQSMKMEASSTVAEEGGSYVVTESATMPQGKISDESTYDKQSLAIRTRDISQGPVTINLKYTDDLASGTMNMAGNETPVKVDLEGGLFADGAGSGRAIAALPLKEGYSTTFRNFDVMRQKVTIKQATVTGIEEVTVPAGTFKAWKVEIASAEGEPGSQTLWVDTESRRVVKTSGMLANGAQVTSELVK